MTMSLTTTDGVSSAMQLETALGAVGLHDVEAGLLEHLDDQAADDVLVLDDEHALVHKRTPRRAGGGA